MCMGRIQEYTLSNLYVDAVDSSTKFSIPYQAFLYLNIYIRYSPTVSYVKKFDK
jgi:hypothetical protein